MSKVIDLVREEIARKMKIKVGDDEANFDVMYPTGIILLDYVNGTTIHVNTPEIQLSYSSIGIVDGSANAFISRPKCGKSTLCIQVIGNLLRSNPDSDAYIDDLEGSLPQSRKEFLLGLSNDELRSRVKFRDTGITTESVYMQIKTIRDTKVKHASELVYDTAKLDIFGNKIFKLKPSFYFIDSFAMLMPESLEEDEMKNKTTGQQTAKRNTELVKKISQLLREANIILFTINHIQENVQMNAIPQASQIKGLKQNERLPGGRAFQYLSNNLFRLDDAGVLKESEDYGIVGNIVNLSCIKTRTNVDLRAVPLIFNKTEGRFDNELSILHFLKINGAIGGIGRTCYFIDYPDVKFSKKNFKEQLKGNPELQQAFGLEARRFLEPLLSTTSRAEVDNTFNINDIIMGNAS